MPDHRVMWWWGVAATLVCQRPITPSSVQSQKLACLHRVPGSGLYFVQSDGLMLPEDQGEDEPTNINDEVTR